MSCLNRRKAALVVLVDPYGSIWYYGHRLPPQHHEKSFGCDWLSLHLVWILSEGLVLQSFHQSPYLWTETSWLWSATGIGFRTLPVYSIYHAIGQLLMSHSVDYHKFADNQQLIVFFEPTVGSELDVVKGKLRTCIHEISSWMASMKLMLNPEKTEFLIIPSPYNLKTYGYLALTLSNPASDCLESQLCSWQTHGNGCFCQTPCVKCNFPLRRISSIRPYLSSDTCCSAVCVTGSVHPGLLIMPSLQVSHSVRFQDFRNYNTGWLILNVSLNPKHSHSALVLMKLHWLPVCDHITFKLMVDVYKALDGMSSGYITDLLCLCKWPPPSAAAWLLAASHPTYILGGICREFCPLPLWSVLPFDLIAWVTGTV